jgi:hypothetical protein
VAKRKALSKKTRFDVFKRDGFKCMYCGGHPPSFILHVDHIKPVAGGGGNEMDNLITSCDSCNLGKGATPLSVVPQSLANKAAEVAEREEQLRGYHEILEAKRQRLESEAWFVLAEMNGGKVPDSAPRDEFNSTKRFIEKLGYHAVLEAMEIAVAAPVNHRKTFRYFCGICWNKVREQDNPPMPDVMPWEKDGA